MLSRSALSLLQERMKTHQFIPFGCGSLDDALSGVPMQGITEISGEAGSGKTQLCLSLAIQSVINRSTRSVEYYAAILSCGEGLFPIKRLSQLAQYHEVSHGISHRDILSHIEIEQCSNIEQTNDTLYKLLPEMCNSKRIKLIIIDSLAGLVRFEYNLLDEKDIRERTQYLFALASQLKWLSETYKIAIVVVNQVTADFRFAEGNQSIPALGLAWSHCVNTRFIVSKPKRASSYHVNDTDGDADSPPTEENKENELNTTEGVLQKRKLSEVFVNSGGEKGMIDVNMKAQRRYLTLDFSSAQQSTRVPFEIKVQGIL